MREAIRIINSKESARISNEKRKRSSATPHPQNQAKQNEPTRKTEQAKQPKQTKREKTNLKAFNKATSALYTHTYNEWILMCVGLCFCFVILLTSSDAIRKISESDGIGVISSSLKSLIEENESVAVFFGFEDKKENIDDQAPVDMTIPTFSYSEGLEVDEYIEKHNAVNYRYSGCAPVKTGVLTSGYSFRKNPFYLLYDGESEYEFHSGADIAADSGEEIRSYLDGVVEKCALSASYGYYVCIDHGDGLKTLYAHASKLLCKEGDNVKKGDVIALVGDTGRATGSHLHFEVYYGGETQNPRDYLRSFYEG